MSFRVLGLSPDPFRPYFAMPERELEKIGAIRLVAGQPGLPCRVSLAHAAVATSCCSSTTSTSRPRPLTAPATPST